MVEDSFCLSKKSLELFDVLTLEHPVVVHDMFAQSPKSLPVHLPQKLLFLLDRLDEELDSDVALEVFLQSEILSEQVFFVDFQHSRS